MTIERLSKLQKWVIASCYKHVSEEYPRGFFVRSYIMRMYFGYKKPSYDVIITRSIWSLIGNGYLSSYSTVKIKEIALVYRIKDISLAEFRNDYKEYADKPNKKVLFPTIRKLHKVKLITLTDKGMEKAKELLVLSNKT